MSENRQSLFEVIACTVDDAIAAAAGGADRLELISHYEVGGLTPALDLVRRVTEAVKIPVRVMLRESEKFEVRDESEIEKLCEMARSFAQLPIEGLVIGFLKDGWIDHELIARLLACAPHLKATFHRAFEQLPDPLQAIEELKRYAQIDYILTRGRGQAWAAERSRMSFWQQAANPEIKIMLGGGTDAAAIKIFCKETAITAFHIGRAARDESSIMGAVQARQVRELIRLAQAEAD